MSVIISGATVLTESGEQRLDVRIDNEVISEMSASITASHGDVVLSAQGCHVLPGFVDAAACLALRARAVELGSKDARTRIRLAGDRMRGASRSRRLAPALPHECRRFADDLPARRLGCRLPHHVCRGRLQLHRSGLVAARRLDRLCARKRRRHRNPHRAA